MLVRVSRCRCYATVVYSCLSSFDITWHRIFKVWCWPSSALIQSATGAWSGQRWRHHGRRRSQRNSVAIYRTMRNRQYDAMAVDNTRSCGVVVFAAWRIGIALYTLRYNVPMSACLSVCPLHVSVVSKLHAPSFSGFFKHFSSEFREFANRPAWPSVFRTVRLFSLPHIWGFLLRTCSETFRSPAITIEWPMRFFIHTCRSARCGYIGYC